MTTDLIQPGAPTPDTNAVRMRRAVVLGWIVAILIAGQIVPGILFPSVRHSYMRTANVWFEAFPDQLFKRLIEEGHVRPATHKENLAWIAKAKAGGNNELSDFDGYMMSQTFVVKDRSTLPHGMFGAQSPYFLIKSNAKLPEGVFPSHNTVFFEESGACVGTLPGCSFL